MRHNAYCSLLPLGSGITHCGLFVCFCFADNNTCTTCMYFSAFLAFQHMCCMSYLTSVYFNFNLLLYIYISSCFCDCYAQMNYYMYFLCCRKENECKIV